MSAARVLLLVSTALVLSGTGLAAPPSRAARARVEHVTQPGKGKFLVASRSIRDPNFAETVILLVEYDLNGGSLGVVVNRPTEVPLLTALLFRVPGLVRGGCRARSDTGALCQIGALCRLSAAASGFRTGGRSSAGTLHTYFHAAIGTRTRDAHNWHLRRHLSGRLCR